MAQAENYIENKRKILPVKYDKSNYSEVAVPTDEIREQIDLSESTDSEMERSNSDLNDDENNLVNEQTENLSQQKVRMSTIGSVYLHENICHFYSILLSQHISV